MKQLPKLRKLMVACVFLFLVLNAYSQANDAGSVPGKDLTESYRVLKKEYSYKNYSFNSNDKYNPYLSGFASLLPGLGQIITGEPGRGLLYVGGMGVSATIFVSGYGMAWGGDKGAGLLLLTGFAGFLTIYIANIVNAVRIAKVKNLALVDKTLGIHIEPQVRSINQFHPVNTFGLGVHISF